MTGLMIGDAEIMNRVFILTGTVAWLLLLFALVCIFRAVPDHEIRRKKGTDNEK